MSKIQRKLQKRKYRENKICKGIEPDIPPNNPNFHEYVSADAVRVNQNQKTRETDEWFIRAKRMLPGALNRDIEALANRLRANSDEEIERPKPKELPKKLPKKVREFEKEQKRRWLRKKKDMHIRGIWKYLSPSQKKELREQFNISCDRQLEIAVVLAKCTSPVVKAAAKMLKVTPFGFPISYETK